MTPVIDLPTALASLLVLGVLIGGAALWIRRIQRREPEIDLGVGVRAWSIGWVNFGLFVCAIIITIAAVQYLVGSLFREQIEAADGALTPWMAILAVITLQLPLLGIFFLLRRFYPHQYADRLNTCYLPPKAAFLLAGDYFLRTLPLIWIVNLLWGKLLSILESAGLVDEVRPQELITVFALGGDFMAIAILAASAVLLAPIVEELIFRGCLYRFLKSQTTLLPAQILSGTLFALMHPYLVSFVPLVVVGVLLARIYESSGNILTAIIYHALFNGFSLLILFLMSSSNVTAPF